MTFTPRAVLVPLVGSEAKAGRIARVQSDATPPLKNVANLNPAIAELADWRLYEAGAIALGAVRRLNVPRKTLAIAARFGSRREHTYLSVTNGPDTIGLQSSTSRSAELGLALALLMHGSQSKDHTVIATGCLSRDVSLNKSSQDDIAVLPVEGIRAKLETIRQALIVTKGSAYPKHVYLFLPLETQEGALITDVFAEELEALISGFKDEGVKLIISPVASLGEAVEILGIKRLELTFVDKMVATAAVGAFALAALVSITMLWLSATIELSFATVNNNEDVAISTPLRTLFAPSDHRYKVLEHCYNQQQIPIYKEGETLLVKLSIGRPRAILSSLSSFHFVVIAVSESSGIKVFPDSVFIPAPDEPPISDENHDGSSPITLAIPIEGPEEKNKLIVLARKLRSFNSDGLRKSLNELIAGVPPDQIINQAVSYLSAQAPGYLDYSFMSVGKEYSCHS